MSGDLNGSGRETASLARLETLLATIGDQVGKLTLTVEAMRSDMQRLTVLEERHSHTSGALDRAFESIKSLKADLQKLEGEVDDESSEIAEKHRGYDKYLWLAVGFITAVSVVWSALGYQLNMNLNEVRAKIAKYDAHIAQDRVLTSDDVRRVHNEAENGR